MKKLPALFWLCMVLYYGFFLTYSTWDIQVEIVFMVTMPFVLGYVTRKNEREN